jgi:hypothetical protein
MGNVINWMAVILLGPAVAILTVAMVRERKKNGYISPELTATALFIAAAVCSIGWLNVRERSIPLAVILSILTWVLPGIGLSSLWVRESKDRSIKLGFKKIHWIIFPFIPGYKLLRKQWQDEEAAPRR